MPNFRKLSDTVLTSPQLAASDIAAAKEAGVVLIVNNRPDGEAPDQPSGEEIARAAADAGIEYSAIPVTGAGFGAAQVDAMVEALDAADGPVLAFCRSGTRSTLLWSLAQAKAGGDPEAISAAAAGAGYDIAPIRPEIDMLSKGRGG